MQLCIYRVMGDFRRLSRKIPAGPYFSKPEVVVAIAGGGVLKQIMQD